MMKKIIAILVCISIIFTVFVIPVTPATGEEDQTQTEHNAGGFIGMPDGNLVRWAQSIKASYSILSKVKLLLSGNDPPNPKPTTSLIMEIRWDVYDSSTTQRSVSKSPGEIPDDWDDMEWIEFDFLDLELPSSKEFYIIVYSDVPQSEDGSFYLWHLHTNEDGNDRYQDGDAYFSIGASEDWELAYSSSGDIGDTCFKTYGYENSAPNTPNTPSGPTEGEVDEELTYLTSTTDPDGNQVYYRFCWGGTVDDWFGPKDSGETVSASYSWSEAGTYGVEVQAKDQFGVKSEWSEHITVVISETQGNSPPNAPSNPDPTDGETDVDVDADLSWTCSDPDGDSLTYDVYFEAGDSNPDELVSDDQPGTTYNPGTMDYEETYYWKIVAKDEHGATKTGPVWDFTTAAQGENQPPNTPSTPSGPTLGYEGESYTYSTSTTDPDGDQVYYKFDFGNFWTNWRGPYDSGETYKISNSWAPGTYKVKAKTKDIHGAETGWSDPLQVTILEKNKAPYTPKNPTPSHQSESIPILTTLSWTGGDPNDGDEVTYDLYISNCPEPDYYPAYAEDLTESEYKDIYLVPDQHYYWRINATDEHGLYNLGPIWNFSTKTLDQVDPTDNNKPGKPEKPLLTPLMPPYLHVGEYCSLTTKVIDPDGDNVNVFYDMDEDGCVDAELLNVSSGEGCTIVYKWDKTPGWHNIRVIATDVFSAISDWSYSLAVNVYPAAENNPPNNASIPGGDNLGYGCEEYTYTTFSVDPDGDDVYYKFDWGDGSYSNWIGPYDSGTAGSCSHYWASTGYYDIRAKVKDYKGKERPWSEAKTVSIVQPGTATIFKHGNFTGATDGDIFDNFPGQGRLRYANGTAGTFVTGAYGGFPYGNAWSMGCQGVEFYVGRTKELTIDAEICFMGGTESALFAPVSIQKVIRVDNFFKPDKEYQKDMENTIGALENLEDLCAATISLLASISPAVWEEGYIYELTKTSFWTEEYLELYNYDVEQAEQLIAKYTGESKMGSKAIENYIKSWRDIRLDGGVKIDPGASSSGASGSATPRIEIAGQPVTTIGGLLLIITIAHQLWTLYQMMTHWQVDTLLEKFENIGQAYTEHAKKTFTFEEGTHDVWAGMRTEATGWLLFFGFAYAVGMVKSITIDGIAPPETPTLTPPQVLRANQVCKFTGFCMDQNDDPVRYIIDWGDGSDTTTELFPSGEDATIEHAYSDVGTYTITVKSEDCDKLQSAGSYTLDVNVLKGKNDAYVNSNPTSTQQQTVPSSQQQTVPSELPGQSTQPDSQSL